MKKSNMQQEIKKSLRPDILLLSSFLLAGLILLAVLLLTGHKGASVRVSVGGDTIETFSLNTDRTYTIEGINGGTNELVIEDGKAWVEEASCPDGLCVNMGKISRNGESIVCLPNQVVVTVIDEEHENGENDVDIITGGRH